MDQQQMDEVRDAIITALQDSGAEAMRDSDAGDAILVTLGQHDLVLTVEPV